MTSHDLITLCFVSKNHRKFVLKKFIKHYNLSTGFSSVKYWKTRIEKNAFDLLNRIHNEIEVFHFEKNYFKLIKKFRHLSLFSVCLHFLTCRRSCEKKAGYCKKCSRVRENCYFDLDKFQDIVVCRGSHYKDDYLFLDGKLMDLG